jgi:hypothetical protein
VGHLCVSDHRCPSSSTTFVCPTLPLDFGCFDRDLNPGPKLRRAKLRAGSHGVKGVYTNRCVRIGAVRVPLPAMSESSAVSAALAPKALHPHQSHPASWFLLLPSCQAPRRACQPRHSPRSAVADLSKCRTPLSARLKRRQRQCRPQAHCRAPHDSGATCCQQIHNRTPVIRFTAPYIGEPEQCQSQRLNNAVHTSLRVERRCSGHYQTTIMMSLFACEGG